MTTTTSTIPLKGMGPESQRVLNRAKEILNGAGGKRKETGKRKREPVREDTPGPKYRPVAPKPKRRRVARRAASRPVQQDEHEDVIMTDVREELVDPSGPMPKPAPERQISPEAAMEGAGEEPQPLAAVPERRKRARKAATSRALATETVAPVLVDEAPAGPESYVREFECTFSAEGCRKRWNRHNDMNTHASRCKFNPSLVSKKTKAGPKEVKGKKGKKSQQ
ncbi:hypothetical protein TWF106_009532 [Orbilia oligospora]|uniref:Uncharacterized protein n=1 Tax=Orbilia oligospora TaxID=2813651 RepID=A0A6G1MK34_ORBOL|nr:hypothetical protein TWF679_005378 [Orbilia oligospora]KAF3213405.1 hypothetical protein TWF106_009532 [Orbilia oligospora]KAF3229958.1 hypothetical protein TWF191_000861 [Orbilia oligospora]KAF3260596.1 hypothetical protein TWF192_009877 [Orbilia oligospora]